MSTLYEIDQSIYELLETGYNETCIDSETGEILEDRVSALLDSLYAERDAKIENIALYIKNLTADITGIKSEEEALAKRRKAKQSKIDSLKDYLIAIITAGNQRKYETARCALTVRESKAVDIIDVDAIPDTYKKVKTEVAPDKTAIKKAIDSGENISGAQIILNKSITIK